MSIFNPLIQIPAQGPCAAPPQAGVCRPCHAHGAHDARGFTLVELMIAILIMVIIMGVAITVMGQTQSAVRRSLQRAQLSLAGQAIDNRLRVDANAMLGPNSDPADLIKTPGALVIVPAIREGYIPRPDGTMSKYKVRLRSDQFAFAADQGASTWVNNNTPTNRELHSLVPTNLHDPAGLISKTQSLIWYGAVSDSAVTPTDGSNSDPYYQAQNWLLGRQAKLLTGGAVDTAQLGITPLSDTAPGTITGLADAASTTTVLPGGRTVRRGGGWTDQQYVQYFANKPTNANNYTNLPATDLKISVNDYRRSPVTNLQQGLQLSDLLSSQLRLVDHCSEIVVQWAGDLDKDGMIDFYPAGHPLANSIVWYPEEVHDKGAWYNGRTNKMDGATAIIYNAKIKPNRWSTNFPTGFTGPAAARFNNHGTQNVTWYKGFEMDYGEQDNPAGQTTAPGLNVPAAYVFPFCDDQYRKVRYGFRQDGSYWANGNDNNLIPIPAGGINYSPGRHYFPFPSATAAMALPGPNSGIDMYVDPDMKLLYANKNPPAGPYPLAASLGITNFADSLNSKGYPGSAPWTTGLVLCNPNPFGVVPLRLTPTAAYPNGRLINTMNVYAIQTGIKPAGSYLMVNIVLGGNSAAGAETIFDPTAAYRSEPLPGFPLGCKLVFSPSVEAGFGAGAMAGNQITGNNWFSIKLGAAATGAETLIPVIAYNNYMSSAWGPTNNYTANYYDVYKEWLLPVNDPTYQNTRDDWRNPQSDWPRLIRIRLRLHDSQGLVFSYSDEALVNGRDDDGDGVVDNPEEGRFAGIWYEFILAVPYPRDPAPRTHAP